MKGKKLILVMASLFSAAVVCAQNFDVLPYEYGFEQSEAAEQANWVLNPGTDLTKDSLDRWEIGQAIHRTDSQALYISIDGGATCSAGSFENEEIVQFAYRDFVLPSGQYYLSFDWVCPNMSLYAGYVNYVTLAQNQQARNITEQLGSSDFPNIGRPSAGALTSETWDNSYFTITVQQPTNGSVRTTRVYFMWVNDQRDSIQLGISAAIDNVQLTSADCEIPHDLQGEVIDCDNVEFTWEGSSARYQLQYRTAGEGKWRNRVVNNAATSYTLKSMEEGNYDIRLRGICFGTDSLTGQPDTTYSPYIYLTNFNIFCPELHCINYINIKDTAWAVCTYGKSGSDYPSSVNAPYQHVGCKDFGWDSKLSRHTVVWDTTATDPRTNNQLRMVPSGSTASVRLGNWETGAEAEAITYKYIVDGGNSILLVNYAIVLEEPTGHGEDGVPRFIIKIKDANGDLIDPDCGIVDLNSETKGGSEWYTVPSQDYYGENIVYKDWTTLGLNLDPYVGQTIYISVETFDCFWSGHYGYAYFTMDCQTARIKNTSCGVQNSMTVHAPSGFLYEWFAGNEVLPRATTQSMEILATDPTDWRCTLTSTENADCKFDLEVNTTARYPQAEFSYEYVPENCENRYLFTNTSYIWTNEDGERHEHRDEVCDNYSWTFGKADEEDDTEEPNPGYVTFPEEGGTYYVTLTAELGQGGGLCTSDTTIKLEIPALGDTHHTIDTTICEGSSIKFHGNTYFETGVYSFNGKTPEGCYSNDTLKLHIAPQTTTVLDTTTICYGDSVCVGDECRKREGVIRHIFVNSMGCDSLVVQPVHVLPHMLPDVKEQQIDENHETGSISVTIHPEDSILYYTINGERYESSTTLTGLVGGTYNIVFYNRLGCTEEEIVRMCAYDIFQRWNDVVSLKNKDQKGGGEFIAYQWYLNGEPIEGATKSYYYKHEGFDGTEVFFCLVTLPDGSQEESCMFTPTVYPDPQKVAINPTNVQSNATLNVTVPEAADVTVYTTMGLPVQAMHIAEGTSTMRAPASKGVYMVTIRMAERTVTERIIVE